MSFVDDLPPLRAVVARDKLQARRALGQNFLFDLNLLRKIALAGGPLDGVAVLEVGAGPGGLTRALLAGGAAHVVTIERDPRFAPALAEIAQRWPGRLTVIAGDALTLDLAALMQQRAPGARVRIVANLPYNVATPLIVGWLQAPAGWPPWWERAVVMTQREVADRIVATPDQRADYGRLAVLANWRCETDTAFDVPAAAFTPPPKVVSSVVRLTPRPAPALCDARLLERVAGAAFGQRRKMLRQSLKSLGGDTTAMIAAAGLDPTQRAETVDIAGFVRLTNACARFGVDQAQRVPNESG